jgi:hypothetical protein
MYRRHFELQIDITRKEQLHIISLKYQNKKTREENEI